MRSPNVPGISGIECPSCAQPLHDFDAATMRAGMVLLTARCPHCHTEQRLEIDTWRGETNVHSAGHVPWPPTS